MTHRQADAVGVAILGCGYWGTNYVRVFNELASARVVAVCDRRLDRLREVERRYPGVTVTTEVEAALGLAGVDAAIVCTEATSHYRLTRICLQAGKHVLVEKPIATSVADADHLIDLARSRRLTLMVGHTFLYNAGLKKVKDYIDRGELGQLYYLYARRTNLGPIRQDVNALWDLAPHDISIFNYLLGGVPSWVSAVGARVLGNGREDVGFIALGYPRDVVGHIHVSWTDPHKVREVVVVGSDKRIVFNDLHTMEQVRVFERGIAAAANGAAAADGYPFVMRDGAIISPKVEASEPLKNQCSHFLERVMQGARPLSGGWEGREVLRVLEAVDRSIARRGTPIEVRDSEMEVCHEEAVERAFR
jgi:predicted dehydrogenase